jgi:hypothetical protein
LIEARIPFDMVHDRLLDAARLRSFETLILPNVAALSDAQCAQLTAFVEAGGGLVATYETSLLNEWGEPREDFGLAGLFGVKFRGRAAGPMQNSYLHLERTAPGADDMLQGLEDAPRIVNGIYRLEVEPTEPGESPLTLIPSYPDLPMEKVYPRVPRTGLGQLFVRRRGAGRVVYFPWDIDRTFWEVLSPDHGKLLANAVTWAAHEPPPVSVLGPGVLDVTCWRQRSSVTVHLVNLTNPMMMKGPFRELISVGPQQVRVRLPANFRPGKVRLLASGHVPRVTRARGEIAVTVPSILDHEVIAIDAAA